MRSKNKHTVVHYLKKEKDDSKRIKNKINNCNPFAGASNYHTQDNVRAKSVWAHVVRELRRLWVERCENTSAKSGCGFGYFFHKSGFPDERSLGERKTEADKPAGRQAKRFELEGNPRQ